MTFGNASSSVHPFFPPGLILSGYIANDLSMSKLLTIFFGSLATYLISIFMTVRAYHPKLSTIDRACVGWFVLTGTIHLFFEGYFAVNHYHMPHQQDLFGQLWKEYAYSDSRYLTSDPFVLCMESVTAFLWGPLSILVAYLILIASPSRHPVQSLVCIGQIYGLILYYMTNTFDLYYFGVSYSRPEFVYFWFYYFLVNFVWIIVPGACLVSSFRHTVEAFKAQDSKRTIGTANGYCAESKLKSNTRT